MVYRYGMAKMNRRTTFALDEETVQRLRKLAVLWHVSQAEVVRKSIEMADGKIKSETDEKLNRLKGYHKRESMRIEASNTYLDEVAENRSDWGRDK